MKYRSDIDGLRAVAVLLVLFFHAGFAVFPSGFIGVDIFFVISGFLISTIIKNSIEAGEFSFGQFYLRRMWRLLPAMLTMILFSLIIATVFYLPADYAPFLKSIKQTILVVSNRYFGDETTGYAAPDANSMLLLHTWSLSIEWQWYLIFPVICLLVSKKINAKKLKLIAAVITVIGIYITYHYSYSHPAKTYYFFASRLFEFMIGVGSCLYLSSMRKPHVLVQYFLSLISLFAILFVGMKGEIILGYPNVYTLVVCLSTAVLIISGANAGSLVNKCLSFAPLVWIGSISYSLYLFHWPIFAVLHYLGKDHLPLRIAGLILALLLATACYYCIEKPFRKPRLGFIKSLFYLVIVPLLAILVFMPVSKYFDGFSYIRFGKSLNYINHVLTSTQLKNRQKCMNENVVGTDMACVVGDKKSETRALLMGDSHSNQYWNFFDLMGRDAHVLVDMKATSLCLAVPNVYHSDLYTFKGAYYQVCHENVKQYYDAIRSQKYKYVIISQVWENYAAFNVRYDVDHKSTRAESIGVIEEATEKAIKEIISANAKPILIKTMFAMPKDFLTCFYEHYKTRSEYIPGVCNPNPNVSDNNWTDKMFSSLKIKYPSLIIVDPKKVQCPEGICKTEINGIPLYRDVGHLNDYATSEFGKAYLKNFGNPLLSVNQ